MRVGVASIVVVIGTLFAAPLLANQPGHTEIPLFKPHRADVVAQR